MSGNKESGLKTKAKQIAFYGSEEAYREAMRERGRKGAKAYADKPKSERPPRGFELMTPEQRAENGRKGGAKSKKTK